MDGFFLDEDGPPTVGASELAQMVGGRGGAGSGDGGGGREGAAGGEGGPSNGSNPVVIEKMSTPNSSLAGNRAKMR